jgi:signal transduction histidine kinase
VVPFYVILVALAVIRYQLMDIRVVVTRTGLLLATYLIVLGVPFAVGWWGQEWLQRAVGEQWWLVPLGLCTALATVGPFAYAYLRRKAERALLKGQRRYQRSLLQAARGMTRVRDPGTLVRLIVRVVSRVVRLQHASLFLWDKEAQRYHLAASHGPKQFAVESWYGLEPSHGLVQRLLKDRRVLSQEDLAQEPDAVVEQEFAHLNTSLVVPGFIEGELVGFLALGAKRSGARYSSDDLHAFSTLANEAAVAIENARSHEALRQANEQLRLAYDRMVQQARLAVAGEFAAGMAHEIKNPLASIKTFAEYLPERYQDPVFRQKFFRIVQTEIDRINTIVKELLDFAKPAPLQLEAVAVSPLIEETLTLLSNHRMEQGVELRTCLQGNGLTIQADPKQLRQVLWNLLLNSLEAMPSGGQLEVTTATRQGCLLLQVADTGCGISEEHQHKVFDPFFTTKERGMGLGLAIVKAVVERHGGRIAIRNRPGRGALVEVSLPVAGGVRGQKTALRRPQSADGSQPAPASALGGHRKTALPPKTSLL